MYLVVLFGTAFFIKKDDRTEEGKFLAVSPPVKRYDHYQSLDEKAKKAEVVDWSIWSITK
jgi:hypothetical protein